LARRGASVAHERMFALRSSQFDDP
jgi:hypothetical protein